MKQSTAGAIIQQKKIRILCFDSIEPPCLSLLDSTFFSVVFWPFQGSNEQPGADTQDSWVSRDHSTPGFPSRASAILKIARRETLGTRLALYNVNDSSMIHGILRYSYMYLRPLQK